MVPETGLDDARNVYPPDRSSSCGKTSAAPKRVLKHGYLEVLTPAPAQYTPEDDIASMPSSFRRIRKSRSMFTTRNNLKPVDGIDQGSSAFLDGAAAPEDSALSSSHRPRLSFLNKREHALASATPRLKAPKSMSFLRHRPDREPISASDQDSALDRTKIVSKSPSNASSPRPHRLLAASSIFFGAGGHKTGQHIRKPLRPSNSSGTLPGSAANTTVTMSIHGSMKMRARKVSASIRSKLKNIFINRSEDNTELPAQQVQAEKTHVAQLFDGLHPGDATTEAGGFHERRSISRVSPRIPSLHEVPSIERLHSRQGSISSLGSEARRAQAEDKSRVTSWASTEIDTAVAQRQYEGSGDWEKQRLSVITEHGFNISSLPTTLSQPILHTTQAERHPEAQAVPERPMRGMIVDSQRVYSALVKKMGKSQQKFAETSEEQRKSSDGSDPFRTLSPPTSESTSDEGGLAKYTAEPSQDNKSREGSLQSSTSIVSGSCNLGGGEQYVLIPPVHLPPRSQEIPLRPIADRRSAFFGSPTSHLFRTRSPWRRSLQEAIQKELAPSEDSSRSLVAVSMTETSNKRSDSASNYSQDTQIHKSDMKQGFPMTEEHEPLRMQEELGACADAPTYRPTGERLISTASSVDWKARLSYDLGKKETSSSSPTRVSGERLSEVEYVVPTMPRAFGRGHVRETAQIGSYEEDEYNSSPPVRRPTNPSTPLSSIEPNAIKLTPQQRSSIQTTPPPAIVQRDHHVSASTKLVPSETEMLHGLSPDESRVRTRALLLSGDGYFEDFENDDQGSQPWGPSVEAHHIRQARSLAQMESFGRCRAEETGSPRASVSPTVRLTRKSGTKGELGIPSAATTPGFSAAFERHFGSLPRRSDIVAKENQSPHGQAKEATDTQGGGSGVKDHGRGGRNMVKLFLQSRRQHAGSSDNAAFV